MFELLIPLWYGMVCDMLFTCIWFHHGDVVVIKQLQVFVTYSLGVYILHHLNDHVTSLWSETALLHYRLRAYWSTLH